MEDNIYKNFHLKKACVHLQDCRSKGITVSNDKVVIKKENNAFSSEELENITRLGGTDEIVGTNTEGSSLPEEMAVDTDDTPGNKETEVVSSTTNPASDLKPYCCEICGRKFKHKSKLTEHLRSHSLKEKSVECALCGKMFSSKSTLKVHLLKLHSESPVRAAAATYKCDICEKVFSTKWSRDLHVRGVHDKYRPIKCTQCGLGCLNKTQLAKHILTHDEGRFPCDKCDQGFRTRTLLHAHVQEEHPTAEEDQIPTREINTLNMSEEEKLKCVEQLRREHRGVEICKLCKKSKPTFAHLMTHWGMSPFKCYTCKKTYLSKSGLEGHSCPGKKPSAKCEGVMYPCDVCGTVLSTPKTQRQHMKRHESPKHDCPNCEKRFVHRYELNDHVKTHENDRLFSCEDCSKRFKTKKDLERHAVVHSKVFGYNDEKCIEGFMHMISLSMVKEKRVKNSQLHTCELCNKSFAARRTLNNHVKTHANKGKKAVLKGHKDKEL